jgi:TRAP-type C4-dicarboxylate transport system substrate-binding protein
MSVWTRRAALSAAFVVAAVIAGPASAQTKLKWAHVYEVAEPYHTQAVWNGSEVS